MSAVDNVVACEVAWPATGQENERGRYFESIVMKDLLKCKTQLTSHTVMPTPAIADLSLLSSNFKGPRVLSVLRHPREQ